MARKIYILVVLLFSNLHCQEKLGVADASALPWVSGGTTSPAGITEGLYVDSPQLITEKAEERLKDDELLQDEGREITDGVTTGLRRMVRDPTIEAMEETASLDESSLWTETSVIGTKIESSLRDEPKEHEEKDRTTYICEMYNLFALAVVPVTLSIGGLIGNSLCVVVFCPK